MANLPPLVDPLFQVHKLNSLGLARADALAIEFTKLLRLANDVAGDRPEVGRELALVRTHLQTACFHAKRAMAMNPENQLKE